MHESDVTDPVALLRSIEAVCCAHGLPHSQKVASEWSGIAFRIGNISLVAPLGEVIEILQPPEVTAVPMTRSWVRGLANNRGSLLPVIDLTGFLNDSPTRINSKTRMLVIRHDEVYAGLLVDEVFGMKHFMKAECVASDTDLDDFVAPYCSNGFLRDGQYWGLFSMHMLAQSTRFLQAAS